MPRFPLRQFFELRVVEGDRVWGEEVQWNVGADRDWDGEWGGTGLEEGGPAFEVLWVVGRGRKKRMKMMKTRGKGKEGLVGAGGRRIDRRGDRKEEWVGVGELEGSDVPSRSRPPQHPSYSTSQSSR
jgi:hypothetical protein